MKRVMTLCVMSFLLIQSLIADNITVEEAQSLAQAFLRGQQDVRKVNGVQPSTTKDLTLAAQLSECFIFNMPQDAGYVIVAGTTLCHNLFWVMPTKEHSMQTTCPATYNGGSASMKKKSTGHAKMLKPIHQLPHLPKHLR